MYNNFKDNPVAAAYVAMYEKQTAVAELEEATDLSKVSTDKLQSMWDSHKDEERPSPALAAQLKRISAELAQRKKSNMKERADWVPEEISDEGVADFMGAAAAAAKKGDKTFKFGDKEYKVTMKKSTADAIDEDEVGYQDRYAVKNGKAVKDNPKTTGEKDQPYHVYADGPEHAVRKYTKEDRYNLQTLNSMDKFEKAYEDLNEALHQSGQWKLASEYVNKMKSVWRLLESKLKYDEEVELGEEYSPQEIKQAIGIAADKRYTGGNMTGAIDAIEKLKAGLSDHPQIKAVLKSKNEQVAPDAGGNMTGATSAIEETKYTVIESAKPFELKPFEVRQHAAAITKMIKDIAMSNASPEHKKAAIDALKKLTEEVDLKEMSTDKAIATATSASMSAMATEIKKYATKDAGIDKAVFLRTAKLLDQGDMKGAIKYTLMQDTDPRDWLLTVMGITSW
jgi:hypothetical protein